MTATDDGSFTFAWNSQSNDFKHWMLPNLTTGMPMEKLDELAEATDKWQHVMLTIQINGVPVSAEAFIEGVKRNMEWWAEKEAHRLLTEAAQFEKLSETLHEVERAVTWLVRRKVREAGVELPYEED